MKGIVRQPYDVVRRRGSLEEAFESTGLLDRLVHLGIGNFERDNVWYIDECQPQKKKNILTF